MNRKPIVAIVVAGFAATLSSALSNAGSALAADAATSACDATTPLHARCMAVVEPVSGQRTAAQADTAPAGYGPADLQSAYQLPVDAGQGQTIAIVDAFDDPVAEQDLQTYRQTYGLPPCTTANGCFMKVNQLGTAGPYPSANSSWALEISLDLQMVSAACPNCHILLVEGNSNSDANLAAAVDTAAGMGAQVISNSYAADEFNGMTAFASAYNHPGVAITAASGDFGFGPAQFPAVFDTVLAVGGTSLTPTSQGSRGWSETAWSGAGSGCSAYIAKPAWQRDTHCHMRTTADVSAVADPATGVAVFDSFGFNGQFGWFVVGGTSVATPLIAAIIGLAGNAATITPQYPYQHAQSLNDVVHGSNGFCGDYVCTAHGGYDGPTGLGTPDGTGAF